MSEAHRIPGLVLTDHLFEVPIDHARPDRGTIEVGKIADLIVVGGDPLADVANVRKLQLVFKDGRVVSDKRGATAS